MNSNPLTGNLRNFLVYISTWIFIFIIYLLLLFSSGKIDFQTALIDSVVFNLLLAGLGLSFWYPVKYISFETMGRFRIFFVHITGGLLASTLWLYGGYIIITDLLRINGSYALLFGETWQWRFFIGLLFYFLITSFYYAVIYYSGFQKRTANEIELKNLVSEAELRTLKFQINPHFIFNSLNSMSALTTIDPDKAREMILKLSEFLRFTLANNEKQKNKLKDELNNIKRYIDIEKIRFEDKFVFIEEVNAPCLDAEVPNMLLQPLFENAIKHAVYESLERVTIKLNCSEEDNFLKIVLENNFEETNTAKKGAGVGLKNIENRLKLIYKMDNLLVKKVEAGLFSVTIYIPINSAS
jgi:two-component system, LytTR family, sensor kinase